MSGPGGPDGVDTTVDRRGYAVGEDGRPRPARRAAQRDRILDAARRCFAADFDASMDDVAREAGVVRRTVYAYFPSRSTLVDGLAGQAGAALAGAADLPDHPDAAVSLAAGIFATWRVADRYRLLLSFARKEIGEQRLSALLEPARRRSERTVRRGVDAGRFVVPGPPRITVVMIEGLVLAALEESNRAGTVTVAEVPATAALAVVGVPRTDTPAIVERARDWERGGVGRSVSDDAPAVRR